MMEILELFLHVVTCHRMAIHPGKCRCFVKDAIFCGLKITRDGVTVDPDRIKGLVNISAPRHVGDVWQFNAAAGWVREDIPLFSEASAVLQQFVTNALKGKPKRNMAAAKRISLQKAGWAKDQQQAWERLKHALTQTITTCTSSSPWN